MPVHPPEHLVGNTSAKTARATRGSATSLRQNAFGALKRFASRLLHFRLREFLLRRRLRFSRTRAWPTTTGGGCAGAAPSTAAAGSNNRPGVNIYGFLSGEFGLAESARQYTRALVAHGVPVALHDLDIPIPHGRNDQEFAAWYADEAPFPVSLLFVNPDCSDAALEVIGEQALQGKYLMACCFWELSEIPKSWMSALDRFDELIVASAFNESAFKAVCRKPVLRVPVPITQLPGTGLSRRDFGLTDAPFLFLCTFDFNSSMDRKNPLAVIESFSRAFARRRDQVGLLIKTANGFRYPDALRRLVKAAATDSRIVVRDDIIGRSELHALQACCDAYVSLHRSEGFGLGMAEAMLLGKPVIATGWSGNLEFMDAGNSCLVNYRLVTVEPGQYGDAVGQHWAEPDVVHAAEWMRRLVSDRKLASILGAQAAADIARRLSPAASAVTLAERLDELAARAASPQRVGGAA